MSNLTTANSIAELIGQTDLLKISSLSHLTGCDIYIKCEFQNPGGSVKDRAALQMVQTAMEAGELKSGMTIVEGTAGNTGIGLALVAKSFGLNLKVVMPKGQTQEKEKMIELHGAELHLVDPVPFANPAHFYHTARTIAEDNPSFWWANQFENTANADAHFLHTGPEIYQQLNGNIDTFISVAGTGGTIGGISSYLKSKKPDVNVICVDPDGSGIFNFLTSGKHIASEGGSFTEGIGIMRLVKNFERAKIDQTINISDQDIVTIANYVRKHDAIVLGSSSALNVAAAFYSAIKTGPVCAGTKQNIVTIACDLGERSASKLYNNDFLAERSIEVNDNGINDLLTRYKDEPNRIAQVNFNI